MHSVLGSILDPAADKALMTTLTITLAVKGMLPRTSTHRPSPHIHPPSAHTSVVGGDRHWT